MIKLLKSLASFNTDAFEKTAKNEIVEIEQAALPLQKGLSLSSYVSDSPFSVTILNVSDNSQSITIKTGVFYTGIIAGCSCSDDPSPTDEQNEYCEIQFNINKLTAETDIQLLETE